VTRLLGVHRNAQPAKTTAAFPGAGWERLFVSDDGRPLPESTTAEQLLKLAFSALLRAWINAGLGVVLSVKLDMDQVRRGLWDDRLTRLARQLAGMRVILIISHEQENDTKAKVSLEGNNRAYDVVKAAAPDLVYATAAMTYAWSLKKAKPAQRVSAADAKLRAQMKADLKLADTYFGKTFPMGILPENDGWARWYEECAPDRWGMGEIGWLNLPGRPEAIDRQSDWFATDPVGRTCELVMVWGTGGTENNAGWLLDDEASAAAVARMMARLTASGPPVGYRPSGLDGFLISERSGCLVAAEFVAEHDAWLTAGR
jgi:hypothetical protein